MFTFAYHLSIITIQQKQPTMAQQTFSIREENGLFQSIDQIMNVNGIGEEKFKLIQDYITIGG